MPYNNVQPPGLVIARNSRLVAGWGVTADFPFDIGGDNFFFDADSGLLRTRTFVHAIFADDVFVPRAVTDSGIVVGVINGGAFSPNSLGVVAKWNPITGAFAATNPLTTGLFYMVNDVSPDGRFGVGQVDVQTSPQLTGSPCRFDFGSSFAAPATFTTLGTNLIGEGRVIIPRGPGLLDIWGPTRPPSTGIFSATLWALNNTGIGQNFPIDNVLDVSDDGTKVLLPNGVWSESGFMPLQGLGNRTDIFPTSISADGRVVGGWVRLPNSGGTTLSTAVVWRDGAVPEDVRALIVGTGLSTGEFIGGGNLTRVSKDGALVASRYAIIDPAGITNRSFVAVIPPKNDGCVTARPVSFGVYRDTLRGATSSLSSNVCFNDANAPDVWYAFTPTANEIVRLDTCGSDFDTTITVYRGTADNCGTSQPPVVCTNDSNTTFCAQNVFSSIVDFSAQIGSVYYIRLAGNFGTRGSAVLTITPPARPANDTCGSALPLDAGFSREVNTANATTDPRPGCPGSPLPFFDLWYRTVAPDTGRMTFSTCGSSGNFVVSVYGEDACANPAALPLACSGTVGCPGLGGVTTVNATKDQVFYLRVGGAFGAQGAGGRINAFYSCDSNQLFDYNLAVLADQPTFHHRFEDSGVTTSPDAVRNDPFSCGNYPGRYFSAFKVPGVLGNAVTFNFFDPIAGVRQIFAPANLGDATLEAWIKTTNPFAGDILQSRGLDSEFGLALSLGTQTEGELAFTNEGPGGFSFGARAVVNVADGRWHHVVGTRRNLIPGLGTIYVYTLWVDGEPVASSSTFDSRSQVGTTADGPWVIGSRNISPGAFTIFTGGAIDEVAVYPRSQSAQQIGDRYLIATDGCTPLVGNRRFIPATTFADPGVPLTITLLARSTRPLTYRWEARFRDGTSETLTDGPRADGAVISGSGADAITIQGLNFPFWESARLTGRAITSCGEQAVTTTIDLPGACTCAVDLSCDGSLDPDDLADYIACYFGTPPCGRADFNQDGNVDPDDLSDYIAAYFAGCP